MTKQDKIAKRTKAAWSPEARRKRELTIARKKAAKESTEVTSEDLTAIANAFPKQPRKQYKRRNKNAEAWASASGITPAGREKMAIQLLEMALNILKGNA
jgi:hypothetical protein